MALCKTAVLKFYKHIIEDVISSVRDTLADEGIEDQVFQDLKELWKLKLLARKAVYINPEISEENETADMPDITDTITESVKQDAMFNQDVHHEVEPFVTTDEIQNEQDNNEKKTVVIEITLPNEPTKNTETRVIKINVPIIALNSLQLQNLLTGPVMFATIGLPNNVAARLLQQHVDAVLQNQELQQTMKKIANPRINEPKNNRKETIILEFIPRAADGANDTSDEDEDDSDDEASEEEICEEEDDDRDVNDGPEENPLNSDDDISDEEPNDLFDTDNIVVCQCEKIIRIKNKWKFYLKDGIMNLDGEDYVFRQANGDADW